MDTIIQKTGRFIFYLNQRGSRLLYTQILNNHTNLILSILFFSCIVLLIMFAILGYPTYSIIIFTSIIISCLFLVLLWIGSLHEARRLQLEQQYPCFQFLRSNLNGLAIKKLGFSEKDWENLNLVLNNLQPKSKIDFRLVSDNRIAADYKKLLRILHLLVDGGESFP